MTSGGYYLSGSDAQLTFAVDADSSTEIRVRWRSGRQSVIANARADRLYEIDERAAIAAPSTPRDTATPLFADASPLLRGAVHVDSLYADFRRQPLLPSRLSQLGPGVSWIDVDQDGSDDLVVGSGRGGQLTVLRNQGGRFTALPVAGGAQRFDLTTVLPLPDGRGGLTLLAGQSNYEADDAATALAVPSVLGFSAGARIGAPAALVGGDSASVGALALGDVNGDGLPDLFVGARAIPGAWPLPARSRMLLGDGRGGFTDDTVNRRAMSALGLVSSALFADLDGDGRPELAVTAEFGPVRVLRNDAGRLMDVTRAMGLGASSSRWNGITTGDFDGDGRLDLIATSWGRNTPWQASADRPYTLLLTRFDESRLALLFVRADSVTQREMPLDGLARLGAALPSVKAKFATFAEFAAADAEAVLGPAAKSAVRIGATTFDHMLFLNRGDHFESRSLPAAAQLAPSSGAVVADFNGDGRDDVFLAQNFFPTEINTMRFDAGAGLLLLGDGAGGLHPQTVRASGIAIRGDMRGAAAADYDADGRVDLAVSQNGAPMTLWHNLRATPGLRLRLRGRTGNPLAIGARVRVVANGVPGAVREIRAGGGAWSMDATTLVLAVPSGSSTISVRWPGGVEQRVPVAVGQRELVLTAPQ